MNLINRIILPLSASLLLSMVLMPVTSAQTGMPGAEESCSCTCADYLVEKDVQGCQAQCSTGWEERECAVSAIPEMEGKDAETQRFEAELRTSSQAMRYPLQENVIASQVYIFQVAAPEYRQAIWEELEKSKVQLLEQQRQESADTAQLQDMPMDEMDAETLRYKAAVEQLNLPPAAIKDLVGMFQANDAPMRELLWQRVEEAR
jgi:hypothetical protein